jgi:hypothetical protein
LHASLKGLQQACASRSTRAGGFIAIAEISSGNEVELIGWHRPKFYKRFYVHR